MRREANALAHLHILQNDKVYRFLFTRDTLEKPHPGNPNVGSIKKLPARSFQQEGVREFSREYLHLSQVLVPAAEDEELRQVMACLREEIPDLHSAEDLAWRMGIGRRERGICRRPYAGHRLPAYLWRNPIAVPPTPPDGYSLCPADKLIGRIPELVKTNTTRADIEG